MQGVMVARTLVTLSRPMSQTTTGGDVSLPSSTSVSAPQEEMLSALKHRGRWQLNWYGCPHLVAVISLSISIFHQMMLQNHPFNTQNLDTISLASYMAAGECLKASVENGK